MPKIELIDVDKIPTSISWKTSGALVAELTEKLREALHKNQALIVRLADDERPARFSKLLRAAADDLRIVLVITSGQPRARTNGSGRSTLEASVLYARVSKAKAAKSTSGSPLPPWETPARPITIPPAPFEKTLVRGVEVSR